MYMLIIFNHTVYNRKLRLCISIKKNWSTYNTNVAIYFCTRPCKALCYFYLLRINKELAINNVKNLIYLYASHLDTVRPFNICKLSLFSLSHNLFIRILYFIILYCLLFIFCMFFLFFSTFNFNYKNTYSMATNT